MPISDIDNKRLEFLIEAYKIRVQFHSEHTNRLWTRFNFLLTAEITLLGFVITVWVSKITGESLRMLPSLGIFISVLWYILGAQDHYYFEGFRKEVQSLETIIANELKASVLGEHLFGQVKGVKPNLVTWRWKVISLSKLSAIFPLVFLALWVILIYLTSA